MTMFDTSDLHKRVERYEAALDELRAAQQDIKNILHDQVLYERWQQLGAELGFVALQTPTAHHPSFSSPETNGNAVPQLAEAWVN